MIQSIIFVNIILGVIFIPVLVYSFVERIIYGEWPTKSTSFGDWLMSFIVGTMYIFVGITIVGGLIILYMCLQALWHYCGNIIH